MTEGRLDCDALADIERPIPAAGEQCDEFGETATCDNSCQTIGGPSPSGCYNIQVGVNCNCAFGLVNFQFSCVELQDTGVNLTAIARGFVGSQPCWMTGDTATDGAFSAQCTIPGGCPETYTITGTFTDADHWDGSFTTTFGPGSCFDCDPTPAGCNATIVNATRVDCGSCT